MGEISYYHFEIKQKADRLRSAPSVWYGMNYTLAEADKVVRRYENGQEILLARDKEFEIGSIGPQRIPCAEVGTITIARSDTTLAPTQAKDVFPDLEIVKNFGESRHDDRPWPPTEPTGRAAKAASSAARRALRKDPRRVMVVYGRNDKARKAMFSFLRALGLSPIEWEQAVAAAGTGSPHNLDAVRSAMNIAQAVIVILTAEDQARLLPALAAAADDEELVPRGQPRQNVILELGLAMAIDPEHTILVELGRIRAASDFEGLNRVEISNEAGDRQRLRSRLVTLGCDLEEHGGDWLSSDTGGDFDAAISDWSPVRLVLVVRVPPDTDATGKSVYLSGTLSQLDGNYDDWDAASVGLTRLDKTHWTTSLSGGKGTKVVYKFTLGSWDFVEKGAHCEEVEHTFTLSGDSDGLQVEAAEIANWRNVGCPD